ncbi:MAG: transposase [Desulfomonilia bacterium]|jgi:hypothetical protein|nr:transposase [Lentisphaerota bacterium]
MEPILVFENNKPYIVERFLAGEVDRVEVVQEVLQRDFFEGINSRGILKSLAESYPWPWKHQEIPCWFYLAASMAMRLHGNHAFHGFPWVVATGGLIPAFGPELGVRDTDPETGETRVRCPGFNKKNKKERETPCDQDTLRKAARGTESADLLAWFNGDVQRLLRSKRFFDKQGVFVGDASHIFVPDNDKYEGSARLLFDENNHPVSSKELKRMDPAKAARCAWRRCYKLVSLIHTDLEGSFFTYAAIALVPGNAHESPILWSMVDNFVGEMGTGVIKRLILDRGFIDAESVGNAKSVYGIDVTIGVKRNMHVYKDAAGLCSFEDTEWHRYLPGEDDGGAEANRGEPEAAPAKSRELWVAKAEGVTSFEGCAVPMNVAICTESRDPAARGSWAVMSTCRDMGAVEMLLHYKLRTCIEERHRHIKCFWDIAQFKSTNFNLVTHQVVMTLLTYSLLQMHFFRTGKKHLNKTTKPRMAERLKPVASYIMVVKGQYYGWFSTYEYTAMVLDVPEEARERLRMRLRELSKMLGRMMGMPGP